LASSVIQRERLLRKCEEELSYLDMVINVKKSACLRVGPRCREITTSTGNSISWVNQMRYLGVFFVKSRVFKCNLDHVKRCFYRAANAIFGRIGRIAFEEVIIQLIKSKCIPVLVYGLEVCPLTKSDLKSLVDFPVNRFFMKLFKTIAIFRCMVNDCQVYFGFDLPSVIIVRQSKKFLSINATCILFLS